jgi:long-chain acyl-CoA synthetase
LTKAYYYSTPLKAFLHWEKNDPERIFLKQPIHGVWKTWTYRQAGEEIRRMATALQGYSLSPKSNIAILSKNCAHWIMADVAIWMAGHVSIPIYATFSGSTIHQILEHSESKILFVGKLDDFKSQRSGVPSTVKCISFSPYGENEGQQWDDLIKNNSPLTKEADRLPEELATIKYTSGTTGNPKGVMITFGALDLITSQALTGFKIKTEGQKFFSYLPLSHIAERMLIEMGGIYSGAAIYFSESLEKFPDNLMETQPTIFLAVPRIWAKFREKIEEKMPRLNTLLKIPLISTVIKKTIRKKLGLSKAEIIFTGAAPISVDLLTWFDKLGIQIKEVYGMTENLAYSHRNFEKVKLGTVGPAWKDVFVKISDEGEIQVKHHGLMSGYFKDEKATNDSFTADGFLRTGDKGEVDQEGFLTITGRIKDQFKTDKAKFVDPAPIELQFQNNTDIEQVCVVGMGIPQPIALVVLSQNGRSKNKALLEETVLATLNGINPKLESYERIKALIILSKEWTVENGLMTPSLKVKRNEVEKIYLPKYPAWYEKNETIVWHED